MPTALPYFISNTHFPLPYEIHFESEIENVEPIETAASTGYESVKVYGTRGSNLRKNKLLIA